MIETVRGVRNAAAIANTPGVDFVLIGTGDLAISLGGFPHVDARHEEACKSVLQCLQGGGRPVRDFHRRCASRQSAPRSGLPDRGGGERHRIVAGGFARAMAQFSGKGDRTRSKPKLPAGGYLSNEKDEDVSDLLLKFASFIADGRIRVVDLTQT